MVRVPSDDHLLELNDGRTIGYATWGEPDGRPVFIGHGTPGSRLDRYSAIDDPEWVRRQRVRFIGVDRPGYGYSDPWPEGSLLDCAGDFVRVADDLGLERFWALGASGGGPYVIALGALAPERVVHIAVVSGADIGLDEEETAEELAAELGEEARMLREEPDEWYAGFVAEVTEVDHRVLERSEVRAITIGMFQEAVRQGAVGWVDDVVRLGRPWPFRLDEVVADVCGSTTEKMTRTCPRSTRRSSPRGYREADCLCTLAKYISLSSITPSRGLWRPCSPPNRDTDVLGISVLQHAIHRSAWKRNSPKSISSILQGAPGRID